MDYEEAKDILSEQLRLLAEASKKRTGTAEELCILTGSMVGVAKALYPDDF